MKTIKTGLLAFTLLTLATVLLLVAIRSKNQEYPGFSEYAFIELTEPNELVEELEAYVRRAAILFRERNYDEYAELFTADATITLSQLEKFDLVKEESTKSMQNYINLLRLGTGMMDAIDWKYEYQVKDMSFYQSSNSSHAMIEYTGIETLHIPLTEEMRSEYDIETLEIDFKTKNFTIIDTSIRPLRSVYAYGRMLQ